MNKGGRAIGLVERIIQHIYVAGQCKFPYNSNEYLAVKSFHLARACDLTDRFADEFENHSVAKKALLRALKQSDITVLAYRFAEDRERQPKPLGLLIDFLMGDVCHKEVTASVMKYFAVEDCPSILTEKSRKEARRSLAWLSGMVASVGVDSDFVTSGV